MEAKKISFGFSKLSKKPNIIPSNFKPIEKKVELIDCLEGHSIKIKDAIEEVNEPLVIPLKDNQKNLLDRVREAKKQVPKETEDLRPDFELSVDELAARQLIKEARDRLANKPTIDNRKVSVLPIKDAALIEGEKEPTLEDYDSVPIGDYGLALLRGMGWKDGTSIGKNALKITALNIPEVRPKGLGLGASKIVQSELPKEKAVDKDGKELILVNGGFAKVIAGVQKGNYCVIQGFDEEAGRVITKVYPKGDVLNINELMLVPVTKEEFSNGSKILNNAKYEKYKEISDKKLENFKVKEESSNSTKYNESADKIKIEKESKKEKHQDRKSTKYEDPKNSHARDSDKHSRRNREGHSRIEHKSESSDSENEISKKSHKHSKSKYKDRSRTRSISKDRHRKKNKKHRSRESRQKTSSSDSDHKEDKRKTKRTKCKSRHRRSSTSSSEDKKSYRNKRFSS